MGAGMNSVRFGGRENLFHDQFIRQWARQIFIRVKLRNIGVRRQAAAAVTMYKTLSRRFFVC